MKIHAAARLLAYDNTWIHKQEQHRKAHPKYQGRQKPSQLDDHIFNMQPSQLSQNLKTVYKDDYDGAMGVLNLYKNRQGKNLKSPDQDRLDKAKTELRKRYGKDDDTSKEKAPGAKPNGARKPADVGRDKPIGTDPIGSKPTTKRI